MGNTSDDREPAEARFERLFREHYAAVLAYARRRVAQEAVDDVVEETFLVVWRRLDEVPDVALPWLYGVARKVIGTQSRGAARRRALSERLSDEPPALACLPAERELFGGVLARLCANCNVVVEPHSQACLGTADGGEHRQGLVLLPEQQFPQCCRQLQASQRV